MSLQTKMKNVSRKVYKESLSYVYRQVRVMISVTHPSKEEK